MENFFQCIIDLASHVATCSDMFLYAVLKREVILESWLAVSAQVRHHRIEVIFARQIVWQVLRTT